MKGMANVLVVDDDVMITRMVARVVEFNGHTPVIETDSFQAAQKCANQPWAAAVVDYMMPNIDGVELLAILMENCPKSRRILLTASPKEPAVQQALVEGIIHRVLSKPFQLDDFELALAWLSDV